MLQVKDKYGNELSISTVKNKIIESDVNTNEVFAFDVKTANQVINFLAQQLVDMNEDVELIKNIEE